MRTRKQLDKARDIVCLFDAARMVHEPTRNERTLGSWYASQPSPAGSTLMT